MITADPFLNCPTRRFRFAVPAPSQTNDHPPTGLRTAPETGLRFKLRSPLAIQVQELQPETPLNQADVTLRILAMESPVPEAPLMAAQAWLNEGQAEIDPIRTMQLQGCTILQRAERLVIFTLTEDRVTPLLMAVLEAVYLEREVGRLEAELAENWSRWDEDIPLSFQFGERQLKSRARLGEHHNSVRRFRSRLERLSPAIHAPHLYPPTFASQASERFRERAQLAHRHEVLGEQLQPFEELYESCAQRTSDYVIARTGHQLEWAIIILLVVQVLFSMFDLLTSLEPTNTTAPASLSHALEHESP